MSQDRVALTVVRCVTVLLLARCVSLREMCAVDVRPCALSVCRVAQSAVAVTVLYEACACVCLRDP